MWEIITREKPFADKSQIEAAGSVAIEGKRPPFPQGIPSGVQSLIENCWAAKQAERMEARQIIEALDNLDGSAKSWLAAPAGYPVYRQSETSQCDTGVQKKKTLKMPFRKKKK